jgi:hypothetical protein
LPPMSRKLAIPGTSTKGKDVASVAMVGDVGMLLVWLECMCCVQRLALLIPKAPSLGFAAVRSNDAPIRNAYQMLYSVSLGIWSVHVLRVCLQSSQVTQHFTHVAVFRNLPNNTNAVQSSCSIEDVAERPATRTDGVGPLVPLDSPAATPIQVHRCEAPDCPVRVYLKEFPECSRKASVPPSGLGNR